MNSLEVFMEEGYELFKVEKMAILDEIKQKIFQKAKELVPYKGEPINDFFNQFHKYNLSSVELNQVRVALVNYISKELSIPKQVYQCLEDPLSKMLGPDIATQKTIGLVVQPPGDREQVPVHRDSPLNSNYEIIVWLPLVDVYGTKSMFLRNLNNSINDVEQLQSGKISYEEYSENSRNNAVDLSMKYGEACLFSTGLTHGCHVNSTTETRWSLNFRYKNLFSPYGSKGLSEFFQIISLSPLTKVAFRFDRMENEQRLSP